MSIRVGLRHMARSAVYKPAVYDAFRKSHEIDGTAVGAQEDYQVEIKVFYTDPWKREASNPILQKGAGGDWDDEPINFPCVLKVDDTYYLYYSGYDGTNNCTGLATGNDGKTFTKINTGIGGTSKVLDLGAGIEWDNHDVWGAKVVYHDGTFYMFYTGRDTATGTEEIGVATSPDGINFTKYAGNPILEHGGIGWRQIHLCHADVAWDAENNVWVMLVSGMDGPNPNTGHETIGRYYCSEAEFPYTWHEDAGNPIIDYGEQAGVDDFHCYHPSIYPSKVNGLWYVFYTARTAYGTGGTICRATTDSLYDGAFTKYPENPVAEPQADNAWEATQVLMPHCALKIGDYYYLYYKAKPDDAIGIVLSENIEAGTDIAGSSLAANEVSLNGKCRTDFGDIRFTGSDGLTELDYWIEEKVDGSYATIWVEVDTIPADPDSATIYIYYGKADATSESDGDATFLFFDDFNDNSIDTDKWDIEKKGSASAVVEEVGEQLHLAGENGVSSSGNLATKTFTITHSFQIIMKRKGTMNYYRNMAIGYGTITGEGGVNWWRTVFNDGYGAFAGGAAALGALNRWDAGVATVIAAGDTISAGDNAWYDEIISYDENGALTWYTTGGTRGPVVDTNHKDNAKKVLLSQGEHGPTSNGGDSYFDYIRIRKYVSTEPNHGAWGEEEAVMWPF